MKPIPAFYCCYLLRSTVRHASLYVGSTPNPVRRLDQHNGLTRGGAVRTSRLSLQPWKMECIVAGFPSSVAALQFEWAWQNPHLTRHILPDQRISLGTNRTTTSLKTGHSRTRRHRPPSSLTEKLSNLHLLLRAEYFARWPLEVRFFSEDVFRVWQTWCQRVDGQVGSTIKVLLDIKKVEPESSIEVTAYPQKRRKTDAYGKGGVEGIDTTYRRLQEPLIKGLFVVDGQEQLRCGVCDKDIRFDQDLIILCPHGECRSVSHITCLARKFLGENNLLSSAIPSVGTCPACSLELEWVELMRELSLRTRGEKMVQQLLKKQKLKGMAEMDIAETESDDDCDDDEGEEEEGGRLTSADMLDEEEDAMSVTSADSGGLSLQDLVGAPNATSARMRLEVVIEDTDDEVEFLSTS